MAGKVVQNGLPAGALLLFTTALTAAHFLRTDNIDRDD